MAINNPYVPGDPYSYDLKWIVEQFKKLKSEGSSLDGAIAKLTDELNAFEKETANNFKNLNVEAALEDMNERGEFDPVFERLIKEYQFTQPDLFPDYTTLEEYYSALDGLAADSEWINSINLTSTYAGNIMKCYVIGKPLRGNYYRTGLIVANMDAREYQGTYVAANFIKMIINNLENNTGSIHSVELRKLFEGYKLFIIPTACPDGYKLVAENYLHELPTDTQAMIKSEVEAFIRGGYINDSDFTPAEYSELLEYCGGDLGTYTFRDGDEKHLWHGTLDGIDIHYNFYTEEMADRLRAYAASNHWPDFPAPRNYIGENGFISPEAVAIKSLIDSNNINSIISIHQRGPTMFYQYRTGGMQFERCTYISQHIANATMTPVSVANSDQIGFAGWFYKYHKNIQDYLAIKEMGWSNTEVLVNGASDPLNPEGYMTNPMPRDLQQRVYDREVNGLLEFVYSAVCNMSINQFYQGLNRTDLASQNPENIDNRQIVVDKYYLEHSGFPYYVHSNSNETLTEIVSNYPGDCIIDLTLTEGSFPNIKRPGLYNIGKVVIYKTRNYSNAKFIAVNGDIWECIITSITSTDWRLTNPLTGVEVITGGNTYSIPVAIPYEPAPQVSTGATDTTIRAQRVNQTTHWKVNVILSGSGSKGIYYQLASIPYPSV